MKLHIDSALSHIIAQRLRDDGYDAVHVRERGLQTASDVEILKLAETEDRVLVSADTDFGTLLALREKSRPSFVLIRKNVGTKPNDLFHFLKNTLPKLTNDLEKGCIVTLTDAKIRIRALPIGGQGQH